MGEMKNNQDAWKYINKIVFKKRLTQLCLIWEFEPLFARQGKSLSLHKLRLINPWNSNMIRSSWSLQKTVSCKMSEFLLEWKIKWQLQSVFLHGEITIDELEMVQDSELELEKTIQIAIQHIF